MARLSVIAITTIVAVTLGLFLLPEREESSHNDRESPVSAPRQPPSVQAWRELIDSQFARDQSCAECHQEQFDAHQRSGHSRTATPAELSRLARQLDGQSYVDSVRDTVFEFERRRDLLFVGIRGSDSKPVFPVHWLLGSGTHAQTPVSIDSRSRSGVEFRWTWLAGTQAIGLTPDHERFDEYNPQSLECFGRPLNPEQALACVGCHMTATPPPDVVPTREAFVPNVGCERCHGPRKKHVELAHQGRAAEHKPLITWEDNTLYLRQCAECHRDETNTPVDSASNILARFQPYGLMRSRCYLDSNKRLSCADCHDPHDAVSHDAEDYGAACKNCHSRPDQTFCSVNSTDNCIQCHMPKVEWHSGIFFHDHWIRVQGRDDQSYSDVRPKGDSP